MMDHTNLKIQTCRLLRVITYVILHTLISSTVKQNVDHSKECINKCFMYVYHWRNVYICMYEWITIYLMNVIMHVWKFFYLMPLCEYIMNKDTFHRFAYSMLIFPLYLTHHGLLIGHQISVFLSQFQNSLSFKSMSCPKKTQSTLTFY